MERDLRHLLDRDEKMGDETMTSRREYNRVWARQDRLKNPEKYKERNRRYRMNHDLPYRGTEYFKKYYPLFAAKQRSRQELLQKLKQRPCMDCGGWFPTCAMQFDHRDPALKTANISRLRGSSVQRILEEVAKCDIVCANCHFIRTDDQKATRYRRAA